MPSPPLSEHHSAQTGSYEQYYDSYPALVPAPPDFYYTSENLYMYQDSEGSYRWADASTPRSDGCMEYSFPFYHPSAFSPVSIPPSAYGHYQHADFEGISQLVTAHDNPYITHLAQQFSNGQNRPSVQDHRLSIARASDNFLSQADSIFSDSHSSSRRARDYRSPIPHQSSPQRDSRPASRKRSRESSDEGNYHVKEKDGDAHPSLPAANDASQLPQSHVISQGILPPSVRIPHIAPISLNTDSHVRERESRLRPEQRCVVPVPKHTSNKRVRTSEEIVRQESSILTTPTTWPIPDDQAIKVPKKPGEQKKQALACLFCRERKIACGRPPAHSPDQTCNQCSRRRINCEYPTESRRGQHKRRRKLVESDPPSQPARTISTPNVTSTTATPSSTILMTTSAST